MVACSKLFIIIFKKQNLFSFLKIKLLIVFLLASQWVIAQRNSVSIGYGIVTTDQFITAFSGALAGAFTGTFMGGTVTNTKSTGAIALSYHRFNATNRVGVGLALVYDKLSADIVNSTKTKISSSSTQAITAAVEGKFKYNKGDHFNIYGLLGAGYTFNRTSYDPPPSSGKDSFDNSHFNFQVTPIGVQFGSAVKGFIELGIGYKGLVSGGLQFNF